MKKYLILASAALVALAACSIEQDFREQSPVQKDAVLTFTSQRPQLTPATKTEWNSTTSSIDWTSADKISVGYTLDGNWMAKSSVADVDADPKVSPRFYASNQVSIDTEDPSIGTFQVPSSFDFVESGKAVFYGVYPNSALGSNLDYAPSLTVTIPTGQTPGNNTFDSSADIMVAKSGEITLTDAFPKDPIELDWTRIVAHADLTFTGLKDDGNETVSKITLTFNDEAKVAGSFYVDVTNGNVTTISGSSNEIVLSGSNLAISDHNVKAWVSLMPVSFTALNVTIETNKAVYSRDISASKTFVKNARNVLSINMSTASKTEKTGQLVADGYYVISYGNSMMTVGTVSDSYRGSAAKDITSPAVEAIWRINYVSENDAYTVLSLGANKYLYGAVNSTSSTALNLGSGDTNLFTIEKTSAEATTYKVAPVGNTVRAIGYNIQSPRFALYTGGAQQPTTLDLTTVTVDETPVITINSEETTKTVAASATSVTFAYEANFFATTVPTVTVTSDQNGIVNGTPTVSDGTITVNLNANEDAIAKSATLTVSGDGIATPITLTINQEAKAGDVFAYSFTSKSWGATRDNIVENWTSGQDGAGFSNSGIQVTKNTTGANGTSPFTFTDISEIVLTYCTNANDGAGTISIQVGDNTPNSVTVSKTGGTKARTLSIKYATRESGKVKITVNCTTNSIYLIGASITAASINLPTAYAITCASGLENGSVEADAETAYEGTTVNLTATPATGYKLDSWNVYKTGDETTKVTVTGNSFTMPAYPVTVSASFVLDAGEPAEPQEVTIKYTGTTTTNMTGGNDAATVGLNSSAWSVVGAKGGNNNFPGLNKAGDIRLYASNGNGNTITVTVLESGAIINSITINYKSGEAGAVVLVGDNTVSKANGVYSINNTSFVIKNSYTESTQVQINSIVINYTPSN